MSKRICFLILLGYSYFSHAEIKKLVIDGVYQQKNIYVQNYNSGSGVGYCATEIKVNGNVTTDEVNSSSFEIDLANLHLKYGEKITIEIFHKDGCMPKILNMEDLRPKPTFVMLAANLTTEGLLNWTSEHESGSLPFIIEQFKWNKWIPVGEVIGKGSSEKNNYSFKVPLTSGENKIRIKQIGLGNAVKVSQEIKVTSNKNKPKYVYNKNTQTIEFSDETMFEVYDVYGNVVKRGFGNKVECQNLPKAVYYLCFDKDVVELNKD